MKKVIAIIFIVLLILASAIYWLLYTGPSSSIDILPEEPAKPFSFNPFKRATITPSVSATPTPEETVVPEPVPVVKIPALRHLSTTPVGGFMASTTASSTVVRYIDRGVGHVFESLSTESEIKKISNTTIPRVYESYWNKNLSGMVLRYMKDEENITNFYAEIRKTASSSDSSSLDYEIKGKFLSSNIKGVTVSPKGDKVFTFNIEDGGGVGYVSGFDESKKTKIFDVPFTQVNIEWPEENTLAINTKASGISSGFLYLFDIKKASMKKILGGITGLTSKVSPDAKKIIFSSTSPRGFVTSLYNMKDGSTQEVVFRTTTDKCVWSRKYVNELYCAVPAELPAGFYPDDWYRGNVSFVDQIWHLDTTTGEVHLVANLLNLSDSLIDAIDLKLDPREDYLYFINKRDLTLWSLNLNQ